MLDQYTLSSKAHWPTLDRSAIQEGSLGFFLEL